MFLTDDPTAVSTLPTPGAAGTPGYFTDGNPGSGTPATILRADFMNMLALELQNIILAAGLTPSKTTFNQVLSAINILSSTKRSVIGSMRNAKMALTSASASATFTADEIIVESALGGVSYQLSSFSKTINLATTGAGGMDTGSAPVSGFVALYAIYNPATATANILAQDTSSIVAPEVYGGSNMPSGYTASALISVWGTNSSRQFVVGTQRDRMVVFVEQLASSITSDASVTLAGSFSIASIVPKNAYSILGRVLETFTTSVTFGIQYAGLNQIFAAGFSNNDARSFTDLLLASPQSVNYQIGVGSGLYIASLYLSGYKF